MPGPRWRAAPQAGSSADGGTDPDNRESLVWYACAVSALGAPLALAFTPAGEVHVDPHPRPDDLVPAPVEQAFRADFDRGMAHALVQLAARHPGNPLPPSVAFFRDIAALLLNLAAHAEVDVAAPRDELARRADAAPPMTGGEYLDAAALERLWSALHSAFRANLGGAPLEEWFAARNPAWSVVGRVCFHLAENKADEARPFAFLATYTTRLSREARPQHRPLGQALRDFQGDKAALLKLLLPVQRAAAQSEFTKELVDRGDVFRTLSWTPAEALRFLRETPRLETAGVVVRVPDWWKKRPRVGVEVTVGDKPPSALGLEALVDFTFASLSTASSSARPNGRRCARSNKGSRSSAAAGWRSTARSWTRCWRTGAAQRAAQEGSFTLFEAMRLLAGPDGAADAPAPLEGSVAEWSQVHAGPWLAQALSGLAAPTRSRGRCPARSCAPGCGHTRRWAPAGCPSPRAWVSAPASPTTWASARRCRCGLPTRAPAKAGGAGFAGDGRSPEGGALAGGAGFAGDGRSRRGRSTGRRSRLCRRRAEPQRAEHERRSPPHRRRAAPTGRSRGRRKVAWPQPAGRAGVADRQLERGDRAFRPVVARARRPPLRRRSGRPHPGATSRHDLVITTYGMLCPRRVAARAASGTWSSSTRPRRSRTPARARRRAVKELKAPARIALTGTPVENRLSDLWSLFDFLNPGLLGTAKAFAALRQAARQRDHAAYGPLRELVRPYILRRLKTDKRVIADLPDKTEVERLLRPDASAGGALPAGGRRAGRALEARRRHPAPGHRAGLAHAAQADLQPPRPVARRRRLRRRPTAASSSGCAEICEEIAAAAGEGAGLHAVPRDHRAAGRLPRRRLRPPRPGAARRDRRRASGRQLVERFQREDGPPFFVLSLKAGGTGLNLTAASHVIHFDRWWNPAVENQATDRAFRIGQKRNVWSTSSSAAARSRRRIDAMIAGKNGLAEELLEGGAEAPPHRDDRRGALAHRLHRLDPRPGGSRMMRGMAFWRFDGGFPAYVPVAERRAKALLQAKRLEKKGRKLDPIRVAGTRIAASFWGKAWCKNLESYSDFASRLPRGRTYLRAGAVLDLGIAAGSVDALVAGSSLYEVSVRIRRLARKRWKGVISSCAGQVDSAIELLSGRVPEAVLRAMVNRKAGLFPGRGKSSSTAPAPTSPACANTSPPSSTAWERGSTAARSCSSPCASWT